MRQTSTPHLEHGDFPDGIVPQDNNDGAVLFFSAQPNAGIVSGGNEIKFRGGAFRTSNEQVIALLDWAVTRNMGIYREEAAAGEIKPGSTAPLSDESNKLTAETLADGKANADTTATAKTVVAGSKPASTGIATSLTAPQ